MVLVQLRAPTETIFHGSGHTFRPAQPHRSERHSAGTILHYDGSSWSAVSSGTTDDLIGLWGSSATDVWAVGYSGTILHWDGNSWSGAPSGTTADLTSVWGSGSGDVWVAGQEGTVLELPP